MSIPFEGLSPAMQVWTDSAGPRAEMGEALPRFDRSPA